MCNPATAAKRFVERVRHIDHGDNLKDYETIHNQFERLSRLGPLGLGQTINVRTDKVVDLESDLARRSLAQRTLFLKPFRTTLHFINGSQTVRAPLKDRRKLLELHRFRLMTKRLFDKISPMIERLKEVIASLERVDTTLTETADICETLDLSIRIKSMSEAVYLGVLAEIEVNNFANSLGFRTAADAASARSGERRGSTKRDVDLAKGIKAQPALSDAFGNGDITKPKAAEILRAEGATEEEQRALIEAAKTESTSKLHRRVEDFRAEHGQEPSKVKNSLTISRNDSGGTVSASLEPVRLNTVEIALDMAIKKLWTA